MKRFQTALAFMLALMVFDSDAGAGKVATDHFLVQTRRHANASHGPALAGEKLRESKAAELVKATDNTHVTASLYQQVLGGLLRIPERVYNHIAVDAEYNNVYEEILTFPERRPRLFNVMVATLKTWLADFVVQMSERSNAQHGSWQFDTRRSAAFAAFGFIYVGLVQWVIYVSIFTFFCPHAIEFANEPMTIKYHDGRGQTDLLKQVFLDNFVVDTFFYFPLFYIIKEAMRVGIAHFGFLTVRNALCRYRENFKTDNIACWSIWVPTDIFIFSAPMWARMPSDHLVSFFWTMVLSHMRGGSSEKSLK